MRWACDVPQDDIALAADRYVEYRDRAGEVEALVFLRAPDAALARQYLDAATGYLELYAKLIGPYPYGTWSTVENFWETGYGMPSFTLLGPKVIRFPFILHTSFPHEILHSWWGNGVFIDYESGNWAEGLTAYLADHLDKEQRGEGAEHRRTTLQKYADFVLAGRDLPLTAFRSRHGSVTEAVGYGKTHDALPHAAPRDRRRRVRRGAARRCGRRSASRPPPGRTCAPRSSKPRRRTSAGSSRSGSSAPARRSCACARRALPAATGAR